MAGFFLEADGAVLVCSEVIDLVLMEGVQGFLVGVAVAIVFADGNDGQLGMNFLDESGIGASFAAVVASFEDVDFEAGIMLEELHFTGLLQVAGE